MINTLVQFCSEYCRLNLQFDMLDFNTGFALVVRLVNTISVNSKKAARWNFQFDIGKQRRNTLFRFMNTLVQISVVNTLVRFRASILCLGFALV